MNSVTLENTVCPLCERGAAARLVESFPPFDVKQCGVCTLLFLNPRLAENDMLARYAAPDYYHSETHGYSNYAAQERALRATYQSLLKRWHHQGLRGESLLELGCGWGFFLAEARPYFKRLWGADFGSQAVELAQTHADQVFTGGLDQIPTSVRFDTLALNQVIEHLYAPKPFLRDCLERLNPGGTLLMTTPDAGSFWRRGLGRRWPSFKIPEHVSFFTRQTLHRLLQETGWQQIRIFSYWHAFPWGLITQKWGGQAARWLESKLLWLPATCLGAVARKPGSPL